MGNMQRFAVSADSCARLVLLTMWGLLAAADATAPLFAARSCPIAAASLYALFAPACHQIPDRSFHFLGHPWAACHRCSGIYLGLFAATLFAPAIPSALGSCRRRRARVAMGALPLLLDALLPFTGIWTSTSWSRFFTGFAFGAMLSSLLVPGVSELFSQGLRRGLRACAHQTHGDFA
jgi:uncharacterized membrane protein